MNTDHHTAAIEIEQVTIRFISPDGKAMIALQDFSTVIKKGEFCAIVGPTGCGKSTTLGLITGLIKPTLGSVKVMGKTVNGIDDRIGFVFQNDALFPWKNVEDNVAAGPLFRGEPKKEVYPRVHDWLKRVGLEKFAKHYPHQLSGGMKKRVSLAQTFINSPQILLMDEPFSALDMQTRTLMQDELLELWSSNGGSVVFVTHDLEEAIALADKVIVLTSRPAMVKRVYEIDLPRPRIMSEIRYDDQFVHYAKSIWNDLRDEVKLN